MCDSLDNGAESDLVVFWYIYGQVLGAVICIFSKLLPLRSGYANDPLTSPLIGTVEHLFASKYPQIGFQLISHYWLTEYCQQALRRASPLRLP